MCRLKSYDARPSGNCYAYQQTEGISRWFPPEPMPEAQATLVSAFRRGNGLSRASLRECLEDVDSYNANIVLRCNPQWTIPCDTPGVALGESSPMLHPCKGCGAEV